MYYNEAQPKCWPVLWPAYLALLLFAMSEICGVSRYALEVSAEAIGINRPSARRPRKCGWKLTDGFGAWRRSGNSEKQLVSHRY